LIDSGIGNKESEKFRTIYGVENAGRAGPTQLDDALQAAGFSASDVRYVVNTHLHFDHAGGNTKVAPDGGGGPGEAAEPAFPNATYVVQAGELEFGTSRNERIAASYLAKNFVPVSQAGRWRLLTGDEEIVPGVHARVTPGHVPHHQSILIADAGETACFLGDLVPTTAHLPLPWIMGYDVEPLVTLETKRRVLRDAVAEGWLLVFEHDPEHGLGRAVEDGKSFGFQPLAG
jgi:glyoxylase-like metal-dependent hydrolase (beta-lactamase superfamily II)